MRSRSEKETGLQVLWLMDYKTECDQVEEGKKKYAVERLRCVISIVEKQSRIFDDAGGWLEDEKQGEAA